MEVKAYGLIDVYVTCQGREVSIEDKMDLPEGKVFILVEAGKDITPKQLMANLVEACIPNINNGNDAEEITRFSQLNV